jgi:hypothetical protein
MNMIMAISIQIISTEFNMPSHIVRSLLGIPNDTLFGVEWQLDCTRRTGCMQAELVLVCLREPENLDR